MFNILLSRFLWSSLSPASSFSPITCPVRLLLGAGVPRSSAGDTTTILLPLPARPSSPPPSPPALVFSAARPGLPATEEAALSSLAFLAFLLLLSSSSLSGDLNTFLAGTEFSSSSDLSLELSGSDNSSLLLLRRLLELERLAWMARLSDLSPVRGSALPGAAGPV